MKQTRTGVIIWMLMAWFSCTLWAGTTGKISGTITDAETGDPLPGAQVTIPGTALGAAADLNGRYHILHVPPGIYDALATYIGYGGQTGTMIRVRIDLTTTVDFALSIEALEGETVTIVAEKTVKVDVSGTQEAFSASNVEELPVSSVNDVVGMTAGVTGDMEIRGGAADASLLTMDGVTMRDPRNNKPVSQVALSSVQEISIERGGFNAEYGNVRSGIVNVVTKDGSKKTYSGSIELKVSPPSAKYFGTSPFDRNSYWLRPYFDDDVCWTGTTNGAWDRFMMDQYSQFEGWNEVSRTLLLDGDPTNDLSPQGAQRKFMWETRKEEVNDQADYNIDAGFGGPVPLIGKALGDMRFFTSYRRQREMLLVPLTRDDYVDYDWSLKLISDISPSMKLRVSALTGKQYTIAKNWINWNPDEDWYLRDSYAIAAEIQDRPNRLFGDGMFSLSDISHQSLSAKLTHFLNPDTYYEVMIEHFARQYDTRPPSVRDFDTQYEVVPGYYTDEAPFGFQSDSENGITGMLFGGHSCRQRDHTKTSATTIKADLSSQLNHYNLIKTGVEFAYHDLNLNYLNTTAYVEDEKTDYAQKVDMDLQPVRAAVYVQDKLETKGFVMNLGLRLDYSNSRTDWVDVSDYDMQFFSSQYSEDKEFQKVSSKGQWQLSPRLGISHPISESSKLFFNYGHFKQMPAYETLFRAGRTVEGSMLQFGDPNLTLAKTVAYELGFDQSIKNQYLLQISAFYRDIFDQMNQTTYYGLSGIEYSKSTSNSYEDVRGFELSLRKTSGRWMTFFGNYTYQVTSSGHFGPESLFEDPGRQKQYNEDTVNLYQTKPVPAPLARFNLSLHTPDEYGPEFSGLYPMGGFLVNMMLNWQDGGWTTHNPRGISGIVNNVAQTDWFYSTLRISKTIRIQKFKVQLFADMSNVFNYKRMNLWAWEDAGDRIAYENSLHLPESKAYNNIIGDDKMGDYRKDGVAYQPVFVKGLLDQGENGVIYYDQTDDVYQEYIDGAWIDVDKKRMNKILDDKAYIDMPNQTSFTFLNPRNIFFGIRTSFDLN